MGLLYNILNFGSSLGHRIATFYHDQKIPDGPPEQHLEMADKMTRAAEQLRGLAAIAQPVNGEIAQQCLERAELHQTWAQKYLARAQTPKTE